MPQTAHLRPRLQTPPTRPQTTKTSPKIDIEAHRSLIEAIGTLHLDRGYDCQRVRDEAPAHSIQDVNCAKKRKQGTKKKSAKKSAPLGMRWTVERTNSQLSNFAPTTPQHRPPAQIPPLPTLPRHSPHHHQTHNRRNRWNPNK